MSKLPLVYDDYNNKILNSKFDNNDAKNTALSNGFSNDLFKSFYVESDYNINNFNELLNETKNMIIPVENNNILLNNYYDNRLDNNVQKDQRHKPKMDMITHFYLTSLSIVALFIVYRMIEKTK